METKHLFYFNWLLWIKPVCKSVLGIVHIVEIHKSYSVVCWRLVCRHDWVQNNVHCIWSSLPFSHHPVVPIVTLVWHWCDTGVTLTWHWCHNCSISFSMTTTLSITEPLSIIKSWFPKNDTEWNWKLCSHEWNENLISRQTT